MRIVSVYALNRYKKLLTEKKLPNYIKVWIRDSIFIKDPDLLAESLIKLMLTVRGKVDDAKFNAIKKLLFPNTSIVDESEIFIPRKKLHHRVIPPSEIHKLIEIADSKETNIYTIFHLISITGLRAAEALRLTNRHLVELVAGQELLDLRRKKSIGWRVVYTDEFKEYIKILALKFEKEINLYKDTNTTLPIYDIKYSMLNYLFKGVYKEAFGVYPPYGMGVHTFRYNIAIKNDLPMARLILGHSRIKTTKIYTSKDMSKIRNAITRVNKHKAYDDAIKGLKGVRYN